WHAPIYGRIAFKLSHFPVSLATSSASVGEAFTLGYADAATIISANAALADAAATAVCNAVQGYDYQESIRRGLSESGRIKGVEGALVIRGGYVGTWGNMPELVSVEADPAKLDKVMISQPVLGNNKL
ncbi:MAG: hypothetical protein QW390_01930, partial [Candidatus Bathyarchaeia archaeon]